MQQLSGLDALFVRCEVGNNHLHIGPVMLYAPAGKGKTAPDFETVRALLGERLRHAEVLRRKLVEVPWKLDRPYWVEDHQFKLENHVREWHLRKPGNLRQFCRKLAQLHSTPIDRSRPLWTAHVIYGLNELEGLPAGSFAIYFKIHHAAMDGATGAAMIAAIHDGARRDDDVGASEPSHEEDVPSAPGLLARALANSIRQPFQFARFAGQVAGAVGRVVKGSMEDRFSGLGWRERTRFNGPVGPDRTVGFVRLGLAEVKALKRRVDGATLNDVTLAIVSGALRNYLAAKGELPDKPLIAGVPVDVRTHPPQQGAGNVISVMTISLCTDVEDTLQRLECVHQQSLKAKAYHHELGPELVTNLGDSLPHYLVAPCIWPLLSTGLLGKAPPIVNTIVSNVPGSPEPLYFAGAEMKTVTGLGPCADGMGLFHSVSSYCDEVTIGFQACSSMLPDPGFYTECIQESWEDLLAAAGSRTGKR